MKKNYKFLIFIIIAIVALYFTRINYGEFGLNKSISACVIVKKQMSKDLSDKEAKETCEREIKKKIK